MISPGLFAAFGTGGKHKGLPALERRLGIFAGTGR